MFKKISFGLVFFVIFASCFLSACSKNIDLSYRTKQYLHLNETLLYHTTSVTAFNEVLSIANDSNEENYYQVANSKKHTIVIKYVNAVSEKTLIKWKFPTPDSEEAQQNNADDSDDDLLVFFSFYLLPVAYSTVKENANTYIYERTLSLYADNRYNSAHATGWLIKRLVANKFILVTNWHFYLSLVEKKMSLRRYGFSSSDVTYQNFYDFANVTPIDYGRFNADNTSPYGVDIFTFEVDFGTQPPDFIQNLTAKFNENTWVVNILSYTQGETYDSNTFNYVGGYPVTKSPHWQFLHIDNYTNDYLGMIMSFKNLPRGNGEKNIQGENVGHAIDSKNKKFSIGTTMQNIAVTKDLELIGGASGSMVIWYDETTQDFYLKGIYWGYWQMDKTPLSFYSYELLIDPRLYLNSEQLVNWSTNFYDTSLVLTQLIGE